MHWNNENKKPHGASNKKNENEQLIENLKKIQTSVSQFLNHTFSGMDRKKVTFSLLSIASFLWLASSIYIVDEGNRGVVVRMGKYLETVLPGPHWHLPYPIDTVSKVNISNQRFVEVGYRSSIGSQRVGTIAEEALMLTKDENIVDVRLAVQYQIKSAKDYLFSLDNPKNTLKEAIQAAERAVIGTNKMDYVLTEGRSVVVADILEKTQKTMDDYTSGIDIISVNLQDAQPPEQVQTAFQDAIKAREDKQRIVNEAEAYSHEILPKARGSAARLIQEAEGYKQKMIATATGNISRFNQLYVEYKKAPEVTRKRLLIESMEKVLSKSDVVMMDNQQSNNLLYLPLDKLGAGKAAKSLEKINNVKSSTTSSFQTSKLRNSFDRGGRKGRI